MLTTQSDMCVVTLVIVLLIAPHEIQENGLHLSIPADDLSLFEVRFKATDTHKMDICALAGTDGRTWIRCEFSLYDQKKDG